MIFVEMGQFKSLRETEKGQKRIARSILLAHKVPQTINKFLVLVEGIDDLPIYRKFFDMNKVDIKDCNGCEHVKVVHDTIKQEREGNKPFLSILDSDFNQLNGNVPLIVMSSIQIIMILNYLYQVISRFVTKSLRICSQK